MDHEKPKKPKGTVGGGRAPGQRNILPPLEKSARATFQAMLGFDDESVAKTGMINGKGVSARQRLFETLHGLRPATPREFMEALKFCWDRGLGTPTKAPADTPPGRGVIFLSPSGFAPWDPNSPINKALDARSAAMIKAKDEQLALEAADRKAAETVIDVKGEPEADEGDTLERVIPPPADPSAFR